MSHYYCADDVRTWLNALDRIFPALSPTDSHFVDWAVFHTQASGKDVLPDISVGWVVSMEVLNSNWTIFGMVSVMLDKLILHADEITDEVYSSSFEVFQIIYSPNYLMTMEVYPYIYRLHKYFDEFGELFPSDMMKFRAAVDRVRQLH